VRPVNESRSTTYRSREKESKADLYVSLLAGIEGYFLVEVC
jgi:hypothetical protein